MPGSEEDVEKALLPVPQKAYGADYRLHALREYELYVEMADRVVAAAAARGLGVAGGRAAGAVAARRQPRRALGRDPGEGVLTRS